MKEHLDKNDFHHHHKIPLQRGTILNIKSDGWYFLFVSLTTDDTIMVAVGKKSCSRDEEQEANIVSIMGIEVKDLLF